MATEEQQTPNNPAAPPSSAAPSLPLYPEMILAAIDASNDKNGSSKSSISKHIEATYGNLPAAHSTLLSHHLNKMKQSGQLIMVKNNYLKPDPNAPPRRGRGRPPKLKEPLPSSTVDASPRPRGRPPKSRDPVVPSQPSPKKETPSGTGRKRGRPAKTATISPPSGAPKGRGRPPKVKPQVAAAPVGA